MKKLLTLALTGVLAAAALAVESEPSNTVGFISRTTAVGYTGFSVCPAGLAVNTPAADILGAQGFVGDQILELAGGGWSAYAYTPDNAWSGLLLNYNGMYVFRNNHGASSTLVVAGDVIPEGTSVVVSEVPGSNQYGGFGNPLPMDVDLDTNDLSVVADGLVNGDLFLEFIGGGWSTYTYNGSFGFDLTAGQSYIIRAANAFTWDYTIPTGALASETSAPVKVAKAVKSVDMN